jgi:hypothetical protein
MRACYQRKGTNNTVDPTFLQAHALAIRLTKPLARGWYVRHSCILLMHSALYLLLSSADFLLPAVSVYFSYFLSRADRPSEFFSSSLLGCCALCWLSHFGKAAVML